MSQIDFRRPKAEFYVKMFDSRQDFISGDSWLTKVSCCYLAWLKELFVYSKGYCLSWQNK